VVSGKGSRCVNCWMPDGIAAVAVVLEIDIFVISREDHALLLVIHPKD
jgi:hypothetical protein